MSFLLLIPLIKMATHQLQKLKRWLDQRAQALLRELLINLVAQVQALITPYFHADVMRRAQNVSRVITL
jgi:hypothetical protein